jgi:signal peptidase I
VKPSKLLIVLGSLGSVLCFALVASAPFFISSYKVPQDGMYPTIPAGSRIFVNRRPYSDASNVSRGDIIVFIRKHDGKTYNYIWRVIGLPGDKIFIETDEVILNGQKLNRKTARTEGQITIYYETIDGNTYEVAYNSAAPPSNRPNASMVSRANL